MGLISNDNGPVKSHLNGEVNTDKITEEQRRNSQEMSLLDTLPFASPKEVSHKDRVIEKKDPYNEALLGELNKILKVEASQIDRKMEGLEKSKNNKELIESILEAEGWGGWTLEWIESTNESMSLGVEFLEHVLPHEVLVRLPSQAKFEKLDQLTTLGGAFLTALESGFEGLALIYKAKLLQESRAVLNEMKSASENNLKQEKREGTSLSPPQSLLSTRALEEWEVRLHLEEESLAEENLEYKISTSWNILYLVSFPLSHFSKDTVLKPLKGANVGLSWMMSGLEIVSSGLELKKTSKESTDFREWTEAYLKWQEKHLPKSSLSIHKMKEKSISASQPLEALSEIGDRSQSLLDKRKEILDKKVVFLRPNYHHVEEKIQALKEKIFVQDMQNILWEKLQRPNCSYQKIKEIMQNWGFYRSSASPGIEPLLRSLDQYENSRQNFIDEFSHWMEHPTAMKEQFQAWYQQESHENLDGLLGFYADHQETIELATRNALKEMVQKKHEIESRFLNLKHTSSKIQFSVALLTFTITATVTILSLLSVPITGAAVILLSISTGSTAISFGLFAANYLQAYREKPNVTRLLSMSYQFKVMWTRLRISISTYFHQSQEKKLLEVAKILYRLHHSLPNREQHKEDYSIALENYKQAKLEFEKSEEKVKEWTDKLKRLETSIAEKSWQDFATQASLQIQEDSHAFDSLRAFQEAFNACDLDLLSIETRTLLSQQLGLDLKALQDQMRNEPDSIRNAIQEFFVQDEATLTAFIKNQQELIQKGILKEDLSPFQKIILSA